MCFRLTKKMCFRLAKKNVFSKKIISAQQSINSNNGGTPSSSNMANSIEHLTMEENNIKTTTQMIQSNAPKETTKQTKQKRVGKGNKEVTSAGGRVPKKTRRMR
jgi:hypothetical protein